MRTVRVVLRLNHLSSRYHTRSIYCPSMAKSNARNRQNRLTTEEHHHDTRCLSSVHVSLETNYQTAIIEGIDSFSVILFILIAFIFSPASWIAYIVREKESKCKHQQVCFSAMFCIPSTHGPLSTFGSQGTQSHIWLARKSPCNICIREAPCSTSTRLLFELGVCGTRA